MRFSHRTLLLTVFLLSLASFAYAQSGAGPSGHWEGIIAAPNMEMKIEIDLSRNSKGELAGTFSQPAQGVKGLPLSTVTVNARSVRLVLNGGEAVSTFDGELTEDGLSMSGEVSQGGFSVPFKLTRTGDARIGAAPKSGRIGKELEGAWNGAMDLGGRQMRVIVSLANQPDGTATGTIVSPDGSGVEIPIAIAHKGSNVTLEVPSVGASFAGVIDAAGTEVTGTWTQGPSTLPLTLRRSK